jgi:uncharacterized sporulation protein YeaH/YhbH (DUF444 family)
LPRRIEEDHKDFRDVVSGRIRKALKKFIKSGQIFRHRGKNGKIAISIPRIDIPHIVFGDNEKGVGRGKGKPGDVIGKDPEEGQGAGQGEGEGITINLDMEEVLKFMQDELELPNLKPKENNTFEQIKIKYNNISLIGPESLRHTRRTMYQAMKRMAASGELEKLHYIPGFKDPMRLITPINSDKRYRQYKEIKIPSSNAVIIYARDGSGSMDNIKCDIVSDMAWWIDIWIRRFYKRVERMWVWHDSAAMEVDEEKFYKYRYGGGTTCSSALKLIAKQFDNRFPPDKWNIYVFYFSDGENWNDDNEIFIKSLEEEFRPGIVNFVGITQILAWSYQGSVKAQVDEAIKSGRLDAEFIRTVSIGPETAPDTPTNGWMSPTLSDDERNASILNAIKKLLGGKKQALEVGDG